MRNSLAEEAAWIETLLPSAEALTNAPGPVVVSFNAAAIVAEFLPLSVAVKVTSIADPVAAAPVILFPPALSPFTQEISEPSVEDTVKTFPFKEAFKPSPWIEVKALLAISPALAPVKAISVPFPSES